MTQQSNSDIGTRVSFGDFTDDGEPVTLTGVVEDEFREPEEEDRFQRLCYRVRVSPTRCYTPYASECWPAKE